MYYKVVSAGQIVDAITDDSLNYVRYQKKNGIFLGCSKDLASGIISSDGSTIYLLDGAEAVNGVDYCTLGEISEEDFNQIHSQLVENGVLEDETEEESATDTNVGGNEQEEAEQEPTAKGKALRMIEALQQELESKQEQIDFLTECVLEMSETVYG